MLIACVVLSSYYYPCINLCRTEQKRNGNSSMPMEIKKSPPDGRANGKTKVISGKKKEPLVQLNSKQQSPQRTSPYHKKSPPSTSINKYVLIEDFQLF